MIEQELIKVTFELPENEALALSQFVKRCGWSEWSMNAESDHEAREMRSAFDKLRRGLAEQGYSPR